MESNSLCDRLLDQATTFMYFGKALNCYSGDNHEDPGGTEAILNDARDDDDDPSGAKDILDKSEDDEEILMEPRRSLMMQETRVRARWSR
jgi:hypothetical protein